MLRPIQSQQSLPTVAEEVDEDENTNVQLQQRKAKSMVSKTFRRIKSIASGNPRRKIFCEIHSNSDVKIWTVEVGRTTIVCAKVFNPAILMGGHSNLMSQIKNVQRLEVEDTEGIMSTLPKSIGSELTRLESFSMSWAAISSLPINLFQDRLKYVRVHRNKLKDLNGIEKASNLELLNASDNCLTALPNSFGELINLTELILNNNALKELPSNICCLTKLKILHCSHNKLIYLPTKICDMLKLEILDVSANQLSGLPASFGNLPALTDLSAADNQLSGLPKSFNQLNHLTSLNLRNNKFEKIPVELKNLENLQKLNFRDNVITDVDISFPTLKWLILDGNLISEISSHLLSCSRLEFLSLQRNRLANIPDNVGCLENLSELFLSKNDIEVVSDSIEELTNLKHLDLKETKISTLPLSLCRMSSLKHINLEGCQNINPYIKLEHKKNGLEGVRRLLSEENNPSLKPATTDSERTSLVNLGRESIKPPKIAPKPPQNDLRLESVQKTIKRKTDEESPETLGIYNYGNVRSKYPGADNMLQKQKENGKRLSQLMSRRKGSEDKGLLDDRV